LPIAATKSETDLENEGEVSTVTSFDLKSFDWTQGALKLLEAYPQGHIRQKAQARIEKSARVHNISIITIDFFNKIVKPL
jgi:hypothetical protein